jgi:anti-sigma regulatory factor (Ser/Thr protein kinase)
VTSAADHRPAASLDHHALILDAEDAIERLLVPHLRRKVIAHESVLMVVGARTSAVVRDRLGQDADTLDWAPADRYHQRLGFAFTRFLRYLREQHARQCRVHIIAEPDLVTGAHAPVDRDVAYLGYEAIVNDVFAAYRCPITCIWNSRHHAPSVIDEVRKVHPQQWTARGPVENPGYLAPNDYLDQAMRPAMVAAPAVADLNTTVWHARELAACRAAVARWAELNHFLPVAVRQVVAATSEVVANGVRHGEPPVRVRAWSKDATLIVQVDDCGGSAIPADSGYRPPTTPADPAGLWVARQLADVLVTHTAGGQTSVRLFFPYAVTHRNLDIPLLP